MKDTNELVGLVAHYEPESEKILSQTISNKEELNHLEQFRRNMHDDIASSQNIYISYVIWLMKDYSEFVAEVYRKKSKKLVMKLNLPKLIKNKERELLDVITKTNLDKLNEDIDKAVIRISSNVHKKISPLLVSYLKSKYTRKIKKDVQATGSLSDLIRFLFDFEDRYEKLILNYYSKKYI